MQSGRNQSDYGSGNCMSSLCILTDWPWPCTMQRLNISLVAYCLRTIFKNTLLTLFIVWLAGFVCDSCLQYQLSRWLLLQCNTQFFNLCCILHFLPYATVLLYSPVH